MTRGPGRHSERNFRAAEQHYNAAEWPTDAERGNVIIIIIIIIFFCFILFLFLASWDKLSRHEDIIIIVSVNESNER